MVEKSNIPMIITVPGNVLFPKRKVEINGTLVTTDVINIDVTPSVTTDVDSATVILDNRNGKHTAEYPLNSIVKIYMDYGTATTKIFEGNMYVPNYSLDESGYKMEIECFGYGYDAIKKKVNYEPATQATVSSLWEYLITTYLNPLYGHSLDFTNIATMTNLYAPSWSRKPIWDCFRELIDVMGGGYDFYCDMDKVWHVFIKGTRNSSEAAVTGDNLKNCRIIDGDLTTLSNRVSVYGETVDSIPRYRMFNDVDSQDLYGIFESDVEDNGLTTESAITAKGDSELSIKTSLEQRGDITIVGTPNILPGYNIYCMIPYCNVMGLKRVVSVTHTYNSSGFITSLVLEQIEQGTTYIMQQQLKDVRTRSMFGMNNSYIAQFMTADYGEDTQTPGTNAELETMVKTVVWEDRLMLELNENSGNAITKTISIPEVMSQFVVIMKGSNLEGDDGEVWNTIEIKIGNADWQTVTKETIYDNTIQSTNIKIRINMISLTTKIKTLGLLWR